MIRTFPDNHRAQLCGVFVVFFFLLFGFLYGSQSMNLISNPSFEKSEGGKPLLWKEYRIGGRPVFEYAAIGRTGIKSVMISSESGANASWGIIVPVKPFSKYRLSGWIKTENLVTTTGRGALLNLQGIAGTETPAIKETNDWTKVEIEFNTELNDGIQVNCLFGGLGNATGKAWFDDISLEFISTYKEFGNQSVTIDASVTKPPISKYIYGQFIEHLGRCINGGIWAEMLEDRKFYYQFGNRNSPWHIIGDTTMLKMSRDNPFVNQQSPEITLTGTVIHAGIKQDSLGFLANKEYVGYVILSSAPKTVSVEVKCSWGESTTDAKVFVIKDLTTEYKKYQFRFTAQKSTDNGVIEVTGTGNGTFRIGTLSLMPGDNINGFRQDIIALLKELNASVYRWPGGNFVSGYNWKDGIGDRDKRPTRKNPAWQGIEPNDMGIDEFVEFCRLINTEPYITVNTGQGTAEMAAEQVEYCNGSVTTPMGKLRAENGHPEPYNAKWWAVGNEMYGSWQLGNMPLDKYVEKHNQVTNAMRKVDPSIVLVASGNVGRWDEGLLAGCADNMDYISEHFYTQERPGIIPHIAQVPNNIKRISDAHRRYRTTIPALAGKDIRIVMDEWNYWYGPHLYGELGTRYFLKDALGIAAGFHEYYKNTDIVFMANYAQTVNVIGCIKTTKTASALETTGQVLKLYRQHFGVVPVEITGTPEPLNVSAAWTEDRSAITIAVVNPLREKSILSFDIKGAALTGEGTLWLITGADEKAYNEPGKEPAVPITETAVKGVKQLDLPPISISLYRLSVKK